MKKIVIILLLGVSLGLFYGGAIKHSRLVNTDLKRYDQNAYLYYARQIHDLGTAHVGDRNRMPLYPAIQSIFYRPGMSESAFFELAKKVNIVLAMLMLLATFFIFRRYLHLHTAINLFLATAFTAFLVRAAYVQAELLFYFMNLVLFLLAVRLFTRPGWKLAALTGVFFGLAHLTKASVLPELALLVVFYLAKELVSIISAASDMTVRKILVKLAPAVLLVLCFISVIFPYIRTSKRIFGHYFYNVNATFYVWCDTIEEWKKGPKAHGDRIGWPTMPEDQVPSLKKYLRQHTPWQIYNRLLIGSRTTVRACRDSYGFLKYLVLYSVLAVLLLIMNYQQAWSLLEQHFFLIGFILSFFAAYFVLVAWWNFLAPQVRHVLALFLPYLFCVTYLTQILSQKRLTIPFIKWSFDVPGAANMAVSLFLLYDIYQLLTVRLFIMQGGA